MKYCSWCYHQTQEPIVLEENVFTRNLYQCQHCSRQIKYCIASGCEQFARYEKYYEVNNASDTDKKKSKKQKAYDAFCGEHNGSISNFSALSRNDLTHPSDFKSIYEPRCINLSKVTKVSTIGLGGALVAGPLAIWAGPAIGGVVGSMMGLSGAAATSAGLAFLGGGTLAAGGAGMAGGLTLITVTGTALGGLAGAVVGNSYFGEIQGRDIIHKQVGDRSLPAVITINGFLTEGDEGNEWEALIKERYSDRDWYHVQWESKRLTDLGKLIAMGALTEGLKKGITAAANKASKLAAKKIVSAATVAQIVSLSKNPWHVALVKAEMMGILLADILKRCHNRQFILMGHSLGARVIYSLLNTLSLSLIPDPDENAKNITSTLLIRDVHLMGGAVFNDTPSWASVKKSTAGTIYNYHSDNDAVLKWFYSLGTFFSGPPVGNHRIESVDGIDNRDVTKFVSGHTQYKKNMHLFLERPLES